MAEAVVTAKTRAAVVVSLNLITQEPRPHTHPKSQPKASDLPVNRVTKARIPRSPLDLVTLSPTANPRRRSPLKRARTRRSAPRATTTPENPPRDLGTHLRNLIGTLHEIPTRRSLTNLSLSNSVNIIRKDSALTEISADFGTKLPTLLQHLLHVPALRINHRANGAKANGAKRKQHLLQHLLSIVPLTLPLTPMIRKLITSGTMIHSGKHRSDKLLPLGLGSGPPRGYPVIHQNVHFHHPLKLMTLV